MNGDAAATEAGLELVEQGTVADLQNVAKWYGPVVGVNDVTLSIGPGITGLVGPNGAGKTSLIRLLAGHIRPSVGSIRILGHAPARAEARRLLGYCPDGGGFFEEWSGRRFLVAMARLHGMDARAARARAEEVLPWVGMAEHADRPLRGYSRGMRQRIRIARALVHAPQFLILDEPLSAVDPIGRFELCSLLRRLAREGVAILISSHILHEIEELADRIVLIAHGRILAAGTLADIRNLLEEQPYQVHMRLTAARAMARELLEWPTVLEVQVQDPRDLWVRTRQPRDFFQRVAALIVERRLDIELLDTVDDSMSAVFDYFIKGF